MKLITGRGLLSHSAAFLYTEQYKVNDMENQIVTKLTAEDVAKRAEAALYRIFRKKLGRNQWHSPKRVYAVPRGGVFALHAIQNVVSRRFSFMDNPIRVVDAPEQADVIVDDIVDSGLTRTRLWAQIDSRPGEQDEVPFVALVDKQNCEEDKALGWVVFPWEESEEGSIESAFVRLLQFCHEDPKRQGLVETPKRMAKAYRFWTSGYGQNPADVLKVFEDGAEECDQMVVVKDIPFYSLCEHHLATFFGTATIAYIPNKRVVGLSKLTRLVDIFARRLQIQERLTSQIALALQEVLQTRGAAVCLQARHMCMESRGICRTGEVTVTSKLTGLFKSDPTTRAEFFKIANKGN